MCMISLRKSVSRYRQRHIAIQIQYEGENFYGFTSQTGGCEETVEKHIFEALIKLRLITDKHVRTRVVFYSSLVSTLLHRIRHFCSYSREE